MKEKIFDVLALVVALAVDLSLNIVAMVAISPGPWEATAFIAVAFLVVVFGVRAWIKGNRFLWAIFAISALFFDVSFILAATDSQTKAVEIIQESEEDPELIRLRNQIKIYNDQLIDLQNQYNDAMQRDTMDSLERQMDQVRSDKRDSENKYDFRLENIESGSLAEKQTQTKAKISASSVFNAIPNAVSSSRFIELFVFLMLFSGLQITIITAADEEKKIILKEDTVNKKEDTPHKTTKALILGNFTILNNPVIVKKHLIDFVEKYFPLGSIPPLETISENKSVYVQCVEVLKKCKLINTLGQTKETKDKAIEIIHKLRLKNYD